MTVALLTLNIISLLTLSVVAFYGAIIPQGHGALGKHLSLALLAILLGVFTHTMTYFYFIGIGSSLRRAVEETGRGKETLRQSRRIKAKVFPWAGAAVLLLMTAFILGGAAHTRALPSWVHGSLGYIVVGFSAVAFVMEARYLIEQNRLVNELQRTLVGADSKHTGVSQAG